MVRNDLAGRLAAVASILGAFAIFLVATATLSFGDADTGRDVRVRDVVSSGYVREETTSVYRAGLSAADAADLGGATIGAVQELTVSGYQTVSVSGRFSSGAAPTVELHCTRWHKAADGTLTFKSMSTATLTGNTQHTIGGKYPSTNALSFDTQGCDVVKILIAAPSTGSVDLFAEVY